MILVAGDIIQDEYIYGDVTRISPEAPVPIVNVTRREVRPGGAANVAANLQALGADVKLLGGMSDIRKTRIIGNHQQMLRIDEKDQAVPIQPVVFKKAAIGVDIVAFSDYDKGSLQYVSDFVRQVKYALVDPKGDFYKYRGAFLLKPNLQEFIAYAGEGNIEGRAAELRGELTIAAFCITLGADGILLVTDKVTRIPGISRQVYDVTGAGDTVLAVLAFALSINLTIEQAAHYANLAGSIVVSRMGTATVTRAELGL